MAIEDLIEKYEEEWRAHKSGQMMSLAEAFYGETWCERFLGDLRELAGIEEPPVGRCAYSGLFGPTWWWRAYELKQDGIPGGAIPLSSPY